MTAIAEQSTRVAVPALDDILGERFPVLDDGFVRVVDYMGGDAAVVQAARTSYGAGTKQVQQDRSLIRYLMRHWHSTPFEMAELKLHVRVPMDTWRQWIRHRTANVNELSTRYSEAIDSEQLPQPTQWRTQSKANRQGSGVDFAPEQGIKYTAMRHQHQRDARQLYEDLLAEGVAREQARQHLPLSTYTEAYWKIDLHNLFHFLYLRMDDHAQLEIRQYARVIGEQIAAVWAPWSWEAFVDYRLEGVQLSRLEVAVIRCMTDAGGDDDAAVLLADSYGWLEREPDGTMKGHRERQEFEAKAGWLGVGVPWIA